MTDSAEKLIETPPHDDRLGSLRGVRREMARLYYDLRAERVQPKMAGTAAYLLMCMVKCLEVELLEGRIDALEEIAARPERSRQYPQVGHG